MASQTPVADDAFGLLCLLCLLCLPLWPISAQAENGPSLSKSSPAPVKAEESSDRCELCTLHSALAALALLAAWRDRRWRDGLQWRGAKGSAKGSAKSATLRRAARIASPRLASQRIAHQHQHSRAARLHRMLPLNLTEYETADSVLHTVAANAHASLPFGSLRPLLQSTFCVGWRTDIIPMETDRG